MITACTLDCPDGCSLVVKAHSDGRVSVGGNPDHPFTKGFTCKKIKSFVDRLRSPARIVHPLLRKGDRWQSITWNAALDLCAEKIQELRHDPASILHLSGEAIKGALYQAVKLFFATLGTTRTRGSLCDAAGYVAYVKDFGSRRNHDLADLLHARRIVNWGRDLSRSSIHTAAMVRKARRQGARVLTISPGGDGNDRYGDERILVRPGTDRFLAAAAIQWLLREGWIDPEVPARTEGWEAFRELILKQSAEKLAQSCEVSPESIQRLCRYYSGEGPTATLVGAGVQRYGYGGENVRFINALSLLSGNIGRAGGGSYFHLHSMRNLNLSWTKDPENKPRRSFLMPMVAKSILEAKDPPVRMIWVNGSNVVNQAPDSLGMIQAFASVPFKVVVDAFMTDTADQADLFLPCSLMLEHEDIGVSYLHHYVNYARKVLDPPGEARSDYWIVSEVGRRLSPPIHLPDADTCWRASLESPHLKSSLEELRARDFIAAEHPRVAYEGMLFDHPDGRYRFPEALHDEPPAPLDYPLRLLTLIRGEAVHSQILPEHQTMPPPLGVSPLHAVWERLGSGGRVFMVSPLGRMEVVPFQVPGLHPRTVVYRRGDWMKLGGGANRLIAASLTDMGNGAPYYQQYVRLEIMDP